MKNFSRVSCKWVHSKRICFTVSGSPQKAQDSGSSPESRYECVMRQWHQQYPPVLNTGRDAYHRLT